MSTDELRKHADAMKKYILTEGEKIKVRLNKDNDISKDQLHPKVDLGCSGCGETPCICDKVNLKAESEEICPKCGKEVCECGGSNIVTEDDQSVIDELWSQWHNGNKDHVKKAIEGMTSLKAAYVAANLVLFFDDEDHHGACDFARFLSH